MAGLGRKTFIATEVLTAANVNGYLMDQSVMKFASSAARSSAIGTAVSEGMVSYLSDTNALEVYDGSSWGIVTPSSGNAILNSSFDIWQRGTSVTPVSGYGYGADRWRTYSYGSSTSTLSQQTFTPGAAPVAGYEGAFFLRVTSTNSATFLSQPIEDVRTFAGQTVTLSFWTKSASSRTDLNIKLNQNFGSGGSTTVETVVAATSTSGASWSRVSFTITLPSISGKIIGTSSFLELALQSATINNAFDIWGVQLEAGSVATPFKRNAPSIQAELAACQRYYERQGGTAYQFFGNGSAAGTTNARITIPMKTTKRVAPTSIDFANLLLTDGANSPLVVTGVSFDVSSPDVLQLVVSVASGLVQYRPYALYSNIALGYIGFPSEL